MSQVFCGECHKFDKTFAHAVHEGRCLEWIGPHACGCTGTHGAGFTENKMLVCHACDYKFPPGAVGAGCCRNPDLHIHTVDKEPPKAIGDAYDREEWRYKV